MIMDEISGIMTATFGHIRTENVEARRIGSEPD